MAYQATGALKDVGFYEIMARITEQFPQAVPLLSQPGVLDVYAQALDQGWTGTDRLNAALERTQWWQTTDKDVRAWQALQITDPATATKRIADTKRVFDDLQTQLGMKVDTTGGLASPGFQLFQKAVAQGWDANRIKYELSATVNGTQAGGEIGKNAADVHKIFDDYGLPISSQQALNYGRQLSEGAIDANGITGDALAQAKSLYPTLGAMLDRGQTVRQIATPYLSLAQQELNIDPNTVSLTDPKWMKALNQVDPKTGDRTVMPLDQWLTTLRTDPSYGYDKTNKAQADATSLVTKIQQTLGAA